MPELTTEQRQKSTESYNIFQGTSNKSQKLLLLGICVNSTIVENNV